MKNIKLVIKIEYQYFGEIIGSIPFLKVCYQAPNGVISTTKGLKRLFVNHQEYFEECHILNEKLLKYQNPTIQYQYDNNYIDCIGVNVNLLNNIPYNDSLYIIAKLIADLYYDFNGEKIGITLPNENLDLLSIYINKYKLEKSNKIRDYEHYNQLIIDLLNLLNVNLNNFNYTNAGNIEDHRGINI